MVDWGNLKGLPLHTPRYIKLKKIYFKYLPRFLTKENNKVS